MHRPRPEGAKRFADSFAAIQWQFQAAVRALFELKLPATIMEAQRRMLKRQRRAARRNCYNVQHIAHGLNGPRAVARRLRQIERGQLREANGLVRS